MDEATFWVVELIKLLFLNNPLFTMIIIFVIMIKKLSIF